MGAFDPIKAVSVNISVPVDSDIGLQYGLESQGLLVKDITYTPTRDNKVKKNHRDFTVGHIFTNPMLKLGVNAEVLQVAGVLAMLHPGEAVNKSNMPEFFAGVDHGFGASNSGYFIADGISTQAMPGDFYQAKFDLTWLPATPDTTTNIVSPP